MLEKTLSWQCIYASGSSSTYRAAVWGGWIVRTVDYFNYVGDAGMTSAVQSESSVFVPDAKHEWFLETAELAPEEMENVVHVDFRPPQDDDDGPATA